MTHNPMSSFNLYHGTTLDNLSKILETQEFTFKPRIDHWLGSGIYFFVDDADKALWWSSMATKRLNKKVENRGILFIEDYKLKRNKLFDLDSEKDRNLMVNFLNNTPNRVSMKLESKDPTEKMIEARSKLIELIVDYHKMSAVKYTFHKENIKSHNFLNRLNLSNNETQLCIVDTDTIDFDNVYDITQEVI